MPSAGFLTANQRQGMPRTTLGTESVKLSHTWLIKTPGRKILQHWKHVLIRKGNTICQSKTWLERMSWWAPQELLTRTLYQLRLDKLNDCPSAKHAKEGRSAAWLVEVHYRLVRVQRLSKSKISGKILAMEFLHPSAPWSTSVITVQAYKHWRKVQTEYGCSRQVAQAGAARGRMQGRESWARAAYPQESDLPRNLTSRPHIPSRHILHLSLYDFSRSISNPTSKLRVSGRLEAAPRG